MSGDSGAEFELGAIKLQKAMFAMTSRTLFAADLMECAFQMLGNRVKSVEPVAHQQTGMKISVRQWDFPERYASQSFLWCPAVYRPHVESGVNESPSMERVYSYDDSFDNSFPMKGKLSVVEGQFPRRHSSDAYSEAKARCEFRRESSSMARILKYSHLLPERIILQWELAGACFSSELVLGNLP